MLIPDPSVVDTTQDNTRMQSTIKTIGFLSGVGNRGWDGVKNCGLSIPYLPFFGRKFNIMIYGSGIFWKNFPLS